jgi:SAM-dependent methyltransferase
MGGYYSEKLGGERLRACYELAPLRTRQYLEAEIEFVQGWLDPSLDVLELGCGYGRILERLIAKTRTLVGIDTSRSSLRLGRDMMTGASSVRFLAMEAARLGFRDGSFDRTLCLQNAISALKVPPPVLFRETVRVTRPGGMVLFSSYSARFWSDRLEWFGTQAAHGLIGPIDHDASRDGVIVCTDGFRATTMSGEGFARIAAGLGLDSRIVEVDESSVFCLVQVPPG